jgi:hypothetical protein
MAAATIYQLKLPNDLEALLFADATMGQALYRKLAASESLVGEWTPPRMIVDKKDYHHRPLKESDFPPNTSMLAMSARATEGLRDLLKPCGEILPTEGGDYYLFNARVVLDILDEEKSTLHRGFKDIVHGIDDCVFKPDAMIPSGVVIFKLPCMPRGRAVFVTNHFVERVHSLGLTGLVAEEIGRVPAEDGERPQA